jgi:hypothetical protein
MPETDSNFLTYRTIRYIPNLLRDEWINVGVIVSDPSERDFRVRMIEEEAELNRLKRLRPEADESLMRGLAGMFEASIGEHRDSIEEWIAKLESVFGTTIQISGRTGLDADDMPGEIERLYQVHVAPPRSRAAAAGAPNTRSGIRAQATEVFRTVGLYPKLEKSVRVDDFTYPGDPFRLDFGYRRNGTRGFVQSLALSRDPSQAKVLAYTAESIREKIEHTEFVAITETEPHIDANTRHKFIEGFLGERQIPLVPLSQLPVWAHKMKAVIQ